MLKVPTTMEAAENRMSPARVSEVTIQQHNRIRQNTQFGARSDKRSSALKMIGRCPGDAGLHNCQSCTLPNQPEGERERAPAAEMRRQNARCCCCPELIMRMQQRREQFPSPPPSFLYPRVTSRMKRRRVPFLLALINPNDDNGGPSFSLVPFAVNFCLKFCEHAFLRRPQRSSPV